MFWMKKRLNYKLNRSLRLDTPLREIGFTVFDTETTGFAIGADDRVIEIGAVHVENFEVTERTFQTFVNPKREIPEHITKLTTITQSDVEHAPDAFEAIGKFFEFIEENESGSWVGHFISFDVSVIKKELQRGKYTYEQPLQFDTLALISYLCPAWEQRDLEHYAKTFQTEVFDRHRALGDALTTAHLFVHLLKLLEEKGKTTLLDLMRVADTDNRNRALQF